MCKLVFATFLVACSGLLSGCEFAAAESPKAGSVDYDAIFADVIRLEHDRTRSAIADSEERILDAIDELKPRPIPEAKPAKQVAPKVVESSPLATVADSYTGTRWTYPGDIDSHLQSSNHGVSASELVGMTHSQKERLHSSLHQSSQPKVYASRVVSQPVRTMSSGCPGGVCPVNRSTKVRSSSQPASGGLLSRIRARRSSR